MKDETAKLIRTRNRLAEQLPDPSTALAGSLMSRMIRCNKPGCRCCEKKTGPGHGPISILSVREEGRTRQIPIPKQLINEVEEGLRRWKQIQQQLKEISRINRELVELRKRR
jgi:hypothetical protein